MDDRQETRPVAPRVRRVWPHKLWVRLFQSRRSSRRLQRQLRSVEARHREVLEQVAARYEEQVALERARFDQMQQEWSSRFVQLAGLQPMLVTDLAGTTTDPRYRQKPDDGDVLDLLNEAQHARYLDEKERFFEEGIAQGASPAEVRARWKDAQEQVIDDILL